jgi:hypothetical protein
MGTVLTQDTVLKCTATRDKPANHGGTLSKSGTSRMKVDGQSVLTAANVREATIPDCANDPNAGHEKCTGVSAVTPGTATRPKVDGEFVVIETLGGETNGKPAGTIAVGLGLHARLKAE